MTFAWGRFLTGEIARVRRGGRAALAWSLRVTLVATASYLVGVLLFPGTLPLLAPLTAMVTLQVTPVSLLASGFDRVVAVVAGVALAVGFASVVPLEWWSLGVLIFVSVTVGQFLRLRSQLMEVAISGMLVLGVGALGAQAAAWQRITETLVGAAVGILANLAFPPKPAASSTGHAVDGVADATSELLRRAAADLDEMAEDGHGRRLGSAARVWLADTRRITRDIRQVDAALQRLEEGRRLNVRAAGSPRVEAGLRAGLEALEHTALAVRSLMRAVADESDGEWLEGEDAVDVLTELAHTFRQMAAGVDAFGELVRNEADVQTELSAADVARLEESLQGLRDVRARLDTGLAPDAPRDVIELRAVERSAVRRLLHELDLEARVRRQVRLYRPSRRLPRPPRRRTPHPEMWEPAGPEDVTQALPRVRRDDG